MKNKIKIKKKERNEKSSIPISFVTTTRTLILERIFLGLNHLMNLVLMMYLVVFLIVSCYSV